MIGKRAELRERAFEYVDPAHAPAVGIAAIGNAARVRETAWLRARDEVGIQTHDHIGAIGREQRALRRAIGKLGPELLVFADAGVIVDPQRLRKLRLPALLERGQGRRGALLVQHTQPCALPTLQPLEERARESLELASAGLLAAPTEAHETLAAVRIIQIQDAGLMIG